MHLIRVIAAAAALAVTSSPARMAAVAETLDQPANLHLVRGAVGHFGGFASHGRGDRGGFARQGCWNYHARHRGNWIGAYPYVYGCPYPYSYTPYCTWPNG